MNKLTGILACTLAGTMLFSGCDKAEEDVMPRDTGRIALYDDFFSTPVSTPVLLNILENDTITTSAELTIEQPQNGVLTPDTATGLYLYTPHNGQKSDEEITYKVCKGNDCKTATVRIKVVEVGSCIVEAQPDQAQTVFPYPVTIANVLANDRTCGRVKLEAIQPVTGGTVELTADRRGFIFTPTDVTVTSASFYYRISGSNGVSTAKVTVKVGSSITSACNIMARPDTIFVPNLQAGASTPYKIVTLNDDIFGCGTTPVCSVINNASHGYAEGSYYDYYGNASPHYRVKYTRTDSLTESDKFTYKVCITESNGQQKCVTGTVHVFFPRAVPTPTNIDYE